MGQGYIKLSNISTETAGAYKCIASNSLGLVTAKANVAIFSAPVSIIHPRNTIGYSQSDQTLRCKISGMPKPKINWFKNGDLIIQSSYFKVSCL